MSSDFITGFCDETDAEHDDTVSLMNEIQYDMAYMFAYSMRQKTLAHRRYQDNVPNEAMSERLQEIINSFRSNVQLKNEKCELDRIRLVLVEGPSSKNKDNNVNSLWNGRTDQNKRILFPYQDVLLTPVTDDNDTKVSFEIGDYIAVSVDEVRGHTLRGTPLWRTTLQSFENDHSYWMTSYEAQKFICT